jgi:hypothetical protein
MTTFVLAAALLIAALSAAALLDDPTTEARPRMVAPPVPGPLGPERTAPRVMRRRAAVRSPTVPPCRSAASPMD